MNDEIETKKGSINTVSLKRLLYLTIAMIQCRNGSRISEAVIAFRIFITQSLNNTSNNKVLVQISKSQAKKYDKENDCNVETKPRFREIMFPSKWINFDIITIFGEYYEKFRFPILLKGNNHYTKQQFDSIEIYNKKLRKSVLQYLLDNFNCNTHSLRYAFINYMIYVKKRPLNDVAKFVGHKGIGMLVNYTQIKNMNEIFDLEDN